jgi:hypothetical protein
MDLRDKQLPLLQALAWMGGVGSAACIATWTLALHLQGNELSAYRKASDWKVSEAITEMKGLSKALTLKASEHKDLQAGRQALQDLKSAKSEIARIKAERDKFSLMLTEIAKPKLSFTVENGSSKYAIENLLLVAVIGSIQSLSTCDVRIGSERNTMEVGDSIKGDVSGIGYRLDLTGVGMDSCSFSFIRER